MTRRQRLMSAVRRGGSRFVRMYKNRRARRRQKRGILSGNKKWFALGAILLFIVGKQKGWFNQMN